MQEIERIRSRGEDDYSTTNQKDMVKNMRNMAQVTKEYRKMVSDLKKIQAEMQETQNNIYMPSSASGDQRKEMEKEIRGMQQAMNVYTQQVKQQQGELDMAYQKTLSSFRQLAGFQQNYSKNFKNTFSSNDLYNLPGAGHERRGKLTRDDNGRMTVEVDYEVDSEDLERARTIVDSLIDDTDGAAESLKQVVSQMKEAEKLDRRSESLSRRAQASKYMSYQQSQNFAKDFYTSQVNYTSLDEENRQKITELGQERSRIDMRIKDIESDPMSGIDPVLIDRKVGLDQTKQAIDAEIDARLELSRTLSRTISNLESYNDRVQGVEVKPERGTFQGMVYERAPAIGLALTGAVGYTLGSMYNRGSSAEQSMRDDVISIGQRTGQTDWRTNVRDNAMDLGRGDGLGLTGQEMLAFQEAYISQRGFQNEEDMNAAMTSQAEFSRVTGMGVDRTADFFENMFDNAVMTGSSVKDIQDAFIGGIKASGMEGREEEQLAALEGLVQEVSQGRVLGQDNVMNLMGIQAMLNSSGHESLRGSRGMEMMTDLNQSIRGGIDDPNMRLLFGMGTKYQGPAGYMQLMEQLEKGIEDPDNVKRIFDVAQQTVGPNGSAEDVMGIAAGLMRQMGADVNSEQVRALYDLVQSGDMSQEALEDRKNELAEQGAQESERRLEEYKGSKESRAEQSEATSEYHAVQITDMADVVREANIAVGKLPTPLYALIAAVTALTVAIASSGGGFLAARGVRRWAKGRYQGGKEGGGGPTSTILGPDGKPLAPSGGPKGGGPKGGGGGGRFGRVGGWFNTAREGAGNIFGRWFDPNVRRGGLPNTGPTPKGGPTAGGPAGRVGNLFRTLREGTANIPNLLSKGKDWFKNLGGGGGGNLGFMSQAPGGGGLGGLGKFGRGAANIAGKAFLPLNLLMGAGAIASAPEGEKASTTGSVIGGIGGGMAGGAAAGAAIGSIFPGIGTAIGGIAGGILGSIGGSKIGGWIGDKVGGAWEWAKGLFGGGKKKDEEKLEEADKVNALGTGGMAQANRGLGLQNALMPGMGGLGIMQRSLMLGTGGLALGMGGMFGKGKQEEGANEIHEQVERETATKKEQNERKRGDNIADELEILNRQEILLKQQRELLFQARSMNGLFGGLMGGGQSQAASVLSGDGNAEKIWNFFAEKGFSPAAISGILGNLDVESGLDPTATNPTSGAYGIGQWLGVRKTNLHNYAKQTGGDASSLQTQLDFMWKELQEGRDSRVDLESFKRLTDPTQAANIFERDFERSGGALMDRRRSSAQQFYNNMKIDSNINVTVSGDQSVSDQVNNSNELQRVAQAIQNKIYGSMNYYSKDMRRV